METISWNEFEKVETRVGTIVQVEDFPEAKKIAKKRTAFLKIFLKQLGAELKEAGILK